jgi:hypothetical protein
MEAWTMAMHAVMSWFVREPRLAELAPQPVEPVEPAPAMAVAPVPIGQHALDWTPTRLATTDSLWGDGYLFPDGENETLRLAKPLGLSDASSLLLLGVGGGGPACSIATETGAWVSGFESDADLAAAAVDRVMRRNLVRRAQIEVWDPGQPNFRKHFYHHGMALEALQGNDPVRVLTAVAQALKPSGHLVLIELAADKRLDPDDPVVAGWATLTGRDPRALPTEAAITRVLRRLKFDVRVVEDISQRQMQQAMAGWQHEVQALRTARPSRREALSCVQEAELWMLRLRLFETGVLRLVRWHAIGGG